MRKTGGERMKKKIVSLLTVMALAATTLAGCGNSTEEAAAPAVTDVSEAEEEVEAEDIYTGYKYMNKICRYCTWTGEMQMQL